MVRFRAASTFSLSPYTFADGKMKQKKLKLCADDMLKQVWATYHGLDNSGVIHVIGLEEQ